MLWDVTSFSLPLASPPPPPSAIDPTVLAALITATVALLAAFVSAGVALYQIRRNAQLEKDKLTAQLEVERERIRYQDQINATRADQECQRQRREMSDEEARAAVERAQTMTERVAAYRDALCADPRLCQLQILDMHHPMPVDQVFVRVRLHQEAKPSYELDPILLKAEKQRDPNELLRVSRLSLETRASTALDPEEAIRTYHRCVVVGDPGAGKTTLLKHLTLKATKCQLSGLPDFPIHIELSAFAGSHSHDLLDFISTRWEDRYGFPKADARRCIEEHLQAGAALLLLDALDETVVGTSTEEAEASYRHVIEIISQLAARYHQTRIIVTARKAGYHQRMRLAGFTELEVLDFRSGDIEQFIDNWFAHSLHMQATTDATDLKVRLSRNTRLQTLAANPLLLSLIVIVYEANLDLPDRRAELYKQCVDILLTKWDASRDIRRRREFKPEHKRQQLEEVAWHFHNQGRRYLPQSELLQIIADFLPVVGLPPDQNAGILEEIASENGLLKEQAHQWYGFLHLTLQEYFVALSLADHQGIEALVQHIGDPWWEEVFFLYAGHTPDASPLLQKLLGIDSQEPLQDDIFHTQLVLAGRCLAARPAIRRIDLREVIIQRLFQDLRSTPRTLLQICVAYALVEIGGLSINTQLLRLLADPNLASSVRESIATALGQLGDATKIVHDLASLLGRSDIPYAVSSALWTISQRMRVRIYRVQGPGGPEYEIVNLNKQMGMPGIRA